MQAKRISVARDHDDILDLLIVLPSLRFSLFMEMLPSRQALPWCLLTIFASTAGEAAATPCRSQGLDSSGTQNCSAPANVCIAPAFQQRKVVSLMEEAQQHNDSGTTDSCSTTDPWSRPDGGAAQQTMGHLEQEEHPELSVAEQEAYRAQLAQQAAQLHGRLSKLTEVAQAGEDDAEGEHSLEAHLEMSAKELRSMHEEVQVRPLLLPSCLRAGAEPLRLSRWN